MKKESRKGQSFLLVHPLIPCSMFLLSPPADFCPGIVLPKGHKLFGDSLQSGASMGKSGVDPGKHNTKEADAGG